MDRTLDVQLRSEHFRTDQVIGFRERQRCGRPAELTVRAVLEQAVPIEQLIGCRAQLVCTTPGKTPHQFIGIIEHAELEANPQDPGISVCPTYVLHVVSRLALLARSSDCRIFQDSSVPDIITQVLEDHGISGDAVAWRIRSTYPVREYCVQYRENTLHFISRLAESEGIYFFTEYDEEATIERIVFADDSSSAPDCLDSPLPLRSTTQLHGAGSGVYSLERVHRMRSGRVTLRSYDFRRPDLDLTCSSEADRSAELEIYEHESWYADRSEGQRLSAVRLEQLQCERQRVLMTADDTLVHAGHVLEIDDGQETTSYFVVAHEHVYTNDRRHRPDANQPSESYRVLAELIPASVPFRPPQAHEAPRIYGPQTATVVAPQDSELESIHTDEHGRCKVRFHWDHSGHFDDKASCWMRVGQLQTSGSMILPRVHWEVVVEFVGGNPDMPIVTGKLYNGTFMPPYALPEGRTRTSLQTASTPAGGGRNEVRFEDRAGAEEIFIHSQYGTVIAAANNREQTIGKDATLTVSNNASSSVGADQTLQVTRGFEEEVGGNQTVSVGANRKVGVNAVYGLTVGGDATIDISGNLFEMNGNPLQALLTLAASRAADAVAAEVAQAVGQVQAAVQQTVNQAMGPLTDLQNQVNALSAGMAAVSNGSLAASAGVLAGASALPGVDALSRSIAAGPAATRSGPEDAVSAASISAGAAINAAVTGELHKAAAAIAGRVTGSDGSGARGRSAENVAGPNGDLTGFSQEDLSQGPGYNQYAITGSHTEQVSAMRITAAAGAVMINAQAASESVGAAHIELIKGSRAESVEGASSESQPAQIVVVGGSQSESVKGAVTSQVGGAVIRKVDGNRMVESKGAVSFAGAAQTIEAKTKLTLKCGGSTVVIDGSGILIQSALVNISAGQVNLPKNVNDG